LDEVIKKQHDESALSEERKSEVLDIIMTQFNFNEDLIEALLKVIFENFNIECKLLPALGSLMQMSDLLNKKKYHSLRGQVTNAIVLVLKIFSAVPDADLSSTFPSVQINQSTAILLLIGSLRLLCKEDKKLAQYLLSGYINQHLMTAEVTIKSEMLRQYEVSTFG